MAEAEKKDISKLDFNISDAINSLEKIDKKLKTISESSEAYAKKIGDNLGKSISSGNLIDVNSVNKNLNKVSDLSKTKQEQLAVQTAKIQAKSQANQTEIVLKEEQKRQTAAYKSALKQEEYNNRVEKSTKTMYDKITEYAKTYVIYQGFNELRQSITETIDEMVNVEYQMVQIKRVLNDSSIDIDRYRDKLIQLAQDYGNSFENVADITLRLAQAGFDAQESLMLTEKTLLALNTAELDATQATEDMVAVMAQWGLKTGTAGEQADSYGDIIDKINKVADNFPTTSEDILNALKKTSSAFNLAGASIDETIATIVAAEKASQRGGKVIGTALSNIVQQLKSEGKLDLAEEMGLDFFTDTDKTQFKPIMQIFQEMSERMQTLKNEGKESSVEMQNLLEMFTVFRRNVGASLLGEMAGEDSTYAQALETSLSSVGYSLQENEQHMKTAKAAQAQFNAELLKLKTSVWDNGVEDVFKSILVLGTNLTEGLTTIVDKIGLLPTAIGAATLAFSAFNKQMRVQVKYGASTGFEFIGNEFFQKIKQAQSDVKTLNKIIDGTQITGHKFSNTFKEYVNNMDGANISTKNYISYLIKQKMATIGAEVATIALNAALTLGLSAAITAVVGLINNLIHYEERYIEKQEEIIEKNKQLSDSYNEQANALERYLSELEKVVNIENNQNNNVINKDNLTEIINLQTKINASIKDNGETIKLVNSYIDEQGNIQYKISENYEEQLKLIKEIQQEERIRALEAQKLAVESAKNIQNKGVTGKQGIIDSIKSNTLLSGVSSQYYNEVTGRNMMQGMSVVEILDTTTAEQQLQILQKFKEYLESIKKTGNDTYTWINQSIQELTENQIKINEETEKYLDMADDAIYNELFDKKTIQNAEDFQKALNDINNLDAQKIKDIGIDSEQIENWDDLKDRIVSLATKDFPEYTDSIIENTNSIENNSEKIKMTFSDLDALASGYETLKGAVDSFNESGQISYETFNSLINNNLLQYLDLTSNKLAINEAAFANAATATKANAQYQVMAEAATQLAALAYGEEASQVSGAAANTSNMSSNTKTMYTRLIEIIPKILEGANAWDEYRKSMGDTFENLDAGTSEKAQNIVNNAAKLIKTINSMTISSVNYQRTSAKSSGGGGSSQAAANQAKREAEQAAEAAKKAEEEAYKARLKQFEGYIDEKERLEKRWVNKQKELGLLSNEDYMFITQQRIERYKKYLEELKKATWMNAEDRLRLEKEYSEKIEDLQVDYIGYLEDQLDDEIKALEDANKKKIELIEKEADARIAALDKVSEATDRAREEEEYKTERQTILDEISYWQQRTGREAQEALIEAKKKLEELDKAWKETQEDWTIEDEIKKIEEERDAEINAIEAAQEAEIKAMQDVYDAKVRMFAETGQIIYEGSVIQAQSLYNAYKTNFIDPISSELANLNQQATVAAPTPAPAEQIQQYETYLIKSGDTLSKIARRYGTTVEKIMAANPYITNKNKIYAGKTLQIPKFHEGGIFGGNYEEGLALLKRGEVILKPSWSASLDRMMRYFDNLSSNNQTSITNGPTINVDGDLIRIEASIKNQSDIDKLEKKIEKMLKDKFNIKK